MGLLQNWQFLLDWNKNLTNMWDVYVNIVNVVLFAKTSCGYTVHE